jgi:hypothetical protein
MDDKLIAEVQAFTLNARHALETETSQQLEGVYGWLPDGKFADSRHYPAVSQLDEVRQTRQKLEQYAGDEKTAGVMAKDARRKLIRETAFTWLNRVVAFRLMEERKLLKQTIVRLDKSNGFIYWLAEDTNKDAYALHQEGSLPQNALGEGPSDIAYRQFLLWQCGELAQEVPVLFDSESLPSRLCPRPLVLAQLTEEMNAETLVDAWKAGNEQTIGWVYEGFIEEENSAVFEKFSKGKKVLPEEIGPATQRFTPRWIVRFLVENSLGRLWVEMHPDSKLKDGLGYLVPVQKSQSRPLKLARDITFLDPCCGSMHFGLVAFDLFVEMYREELGHVGQQGWPATASVSSEDDIPSSVIFHNLFGIDLDLRAVQISSLTLYIKARTLNPKCTFTDLNLACANVEQISGGKLEAMITGAQFSHPIYERILRGLAAQCKDSDQLGSLLRLEKTLERLIEDERKKAESGGRTQLHLPGMSVEQFKTREKLEEFFGAVAEQTLQQLDVFVRASRKGEEDPGHFVNEAEKGMRYMRIVSRHHDVVATNPPYMSRRNMSEVMTRHLDAEFQNAKGDLYAAFISRCTELAGSLGKIAMVTQQSFMFISTYEALRAHLRSTVGIESMAHLGPRAFPNISGEKVNTTAFVFEKQPNERQREEQVGIYFRLVREPDADSKRRAFESALTANQCGQPHFLCFSQQQKNFDAICGSPLVYWIPGRIRRIFETLPKLESLAEPKQGLATADDTRFLRLWWEVGKPRMRFGAAGRNMKWVPFVKGGGYQKWYGKQDYALNWGESGRELKAFKNAVIRNERFYFRSGLTWSALSSAGLSCRQLGAVFIFGHKGPAIFAERRGTLDSLIAILNSRFGSYLLKITSPTVMFEVGQIAKLPIVTGRSAKLSDLVEKAICLQAESSRQDETTYDFIQPASLCLQQQSRRSDLIKIENEIDEEVFELYNVTSEEKSLVEEELAVAGEDSILSDDPDLDNQSTIPEEHCPQWICYSIGAILGRFEIGTRNGLGCGEFPHDAAQALEGLVDPDGIMVADPGHPQDMVKRSLACLELMLGQEAAHDAIRTATGAEGDREQLLRDYLDKRFWKYHFQQYRKRPIYWPLQSPKKRFTVWVFQEKFTKDTLFKVRSDFVEPKIRWLESRIKELKSKASASEGRERRTAEKEASQLADIFDDVQEFAKRLNKITQRGYTPHIDDGVLLNAAPLWELLPSWPETKKAWEELEAGEYDWAQQAMEYWPARVKEKCKTNKSFAIAHGLA